MTRNNLFKKTNLSDDSTGPNSDQYSIQWHKGTVKTLHQEEQQANVFVLHFSDDAENIWVLLGKCTQKEAAYKMQRYICYN